MPLVTRDSLVAHLRVLQLDWADEEDATILVDVMLEAFTPYFVMTWIHWLDDELETAPILLLRDGQFRRVLMRARNMVASAS